MISTASRVNEKLMSREGAYIWPLSKWIDLSLVNHTAYSSGAVSLAYAFARWIRADTLHRLRIISEPLATRTLVCPNRPSPVVRRRFREDAGRFPRVSRLTALGLKFERPFAEGTVCNQAELAELAHVSRTRVCQT
jgi:hypothetical protein